MPKLFDCGTFCRLGFKCAALLPGIRLLRRKMALKEDSALSEIAAHFQKLRCTCKEDCVVSQITVRLREITPHFCDDHELARKTVHFSDCSTLGPIAAWPSKCGAHNLASGSAEFASFSKCVCGAFVAFLRVPYIHALRKSVPCTLHSAQSTIYAGKLWIVVQYANPNPCFAPNIHMYYKCCAILTIIVLSQKLTYVSGHLGLFIYHNALFPSYLAAILLHKVRQQLWSLCNCCKTY